MRISKYQRQLEYRERQKGKGMIFLQRWVTPAEKAAIESLLTALRAHQDKAA